MQTPTFHYGGRGRGTGGYYSSYTQSQLDDVQRNADARCEQLRKERQKYEAAGQSVSALQDSAANLESQIADQKLTGSGVRLVPLGTNLNVRNYESYHSDQDDRDAIVPLIAQPKKLTDISDSARKTSSPMPAAAR